MKIVHICTSLGGGAGLCAKRIILSTRAAGIDARAIIAAGKSEEYVCVVNPTYPWSKNRFINRFPLLQRLMVHWSKAATIYRRINREEDKNCTFVPFTSPVTLYKDIVYHPWIKEADLIHLHWIGDFVDFESFFSGINKPIVWTIHDENPGLGGFHYQMWKNHATESFKIFDDELAILKEKAYKCVKSMTLVAISAKMKVFFENNKLLSAFPCTVIHNGIEDNKFIMIPKKCAREVLNLSEESAIFLFVAQNIHEDRKGLKELIEALEILKINNIVLICLGSFNNTPKASFEVKCEGFVGDNRLLSLYYSAADYYIMPSFQEAFAQTPIEAMACGSPVVAFPCSGADDLINEDNGIICEDFTVDALVKGVKLVMGRTYHSDIIREDVIRRFSYDMIAKQYIGLYKSVLNKK